MFSIECPECVTTYRPASLGFTPSEDEPTTATLKCVVCGTTFDAKATPQVVEAGWLARVWSRVPATVEYVVETVVRQRADSGRSRGR